MRNSGRFVLTKKIWKKMVVMLSIMLMVLSVSLAVRAEEGLQQDILPVSGNVLILDEGEIVEVPMILVQSPDADASINSSSQTVIGTAGTLKVWGNGNYFYWTISMLVPATSFSGYISCVDMNTGLSSGYVSASGFSGQRYCARITGHNYIAHLTGNAYLGSVKVATTCTNTIIWKA